MIDTHYMNPVSIPTFESSFKLGRAIFPDWTHEIPSTHICSHCQQPLFLAFRETDNRPVLACALCARLYLSKATKSLLIQAKELQGGRDKYKNRIEVINTLQEPIDLNKTEIEGFNYKIQNNQNTKSDNPNRKNTHSKTNISKRYKLIFSIDTMQTRIFLLDSLQILANFFSDRCELIYQWNTIAFHVDPSIPKLFIQTFLQIVGQVCGFNCSFSSDPLSESLSSYQIPILHSLLVNLGNKWEKPAQASIL